MDTKRDFTVSTTITRGEYYEINGLNIWDYEWKLTGERLLVEDDGSGRKSSHYIVEISGNGNSAKFVADEYSNSVYRIYHRY